MTSKSIFNISTLFPSISLYEDRNNGSRLDIIYSVYEDRPFRYKFTVEDYLCYCFGLILKKIDIIDFDGLAKSIKYSEKEKLGLTSWEVNFLYSIIKNKILAKQPISSRQFKCLKKMKFSFINEDYRVVIDESNLEKSLKLTHVKEKEIKHLYGDFIGIRYDYDKDIIQILKDLFKDTYICYNPELEMNIVKLSKLKFNDLEFLKSKGFYIEPKIYDYMELRNEKFFEVGFKDGIISIVGSGKFTYSLLKTLAITGNIS